MSTITRTLGAGTDWAAMNNAARSDGVQRKALERADSGSKGLDEGEQRSVRAQVRESTGLDTHGSARLAKRLDTSADGRLSAGELDEGAKTLVPPPKDTMEFIQRRLGPDEEPAPQGDVFDRIDADADGGLRKGEFLAAGPAHRPGVLDATPDDAATTAGSADAAYARLAKAFDAADGDGDGALNKSEFHALKAQARESAADALGVSADDESLNASAAVASYRKDRFDLVRFAESLPGQDSTPA